MAEYIDVDKLQKEFEEVCVGECDCCAREEGCPVYTQSTVNAIPIPESATNGDMIKAMFPNAEIEGIEGLEGLEYVTVSIDWGTSYFALDWWNTPYKIGVKE